MAGELAIIQEVIAQHQIIRLDLIQVQSSLTDFDALFSLQQAQAVWAKSSMDKPLEQKRKLQANLSRVQKGVDAHFSWEERVFPPLFGEAFMKAIFFVHTEIRQQIERTISTVDGSTMTGPNLEDILNQKSLLQESITKTNQMIEEHAILEEQMLLMLKKTFESEAKSPKTGQE